MTVNNSLHVVEQRKRNAIALLSMGKVRQALEDLLRNPEALHYWQIAEGNASTLLEVIREARSSEEVKRLTAVEEQFNSKNLFSEAHL